MPPAALSLSDVGPMLLEERKTLPATGEWHYEIKYDGYRILAATGEPRLKTKGGADATKWFPELAGTLAALPSGHILDGEVCVLDDIGRADFDKVHTRALRRRWYEGADLVVYCAFDLLVHKGRDIRVQPIEVRKRRLRQLLHGVREGILFVDSVDDGAWLYEQVLKLQMEGVVAKRAGSAYIGGRSHDWLKIKRPGAIPAGRFRRAP